jgi:hypothetical protein
MITSFVCSAEVVSVASEPSSLLISILTSSLVAALISPLASMILAHRKSVQEEKSRVRTLFAEAYQAATDYAEFPYAIRRRRADEPAAERIRLSEQLRQIQSKISFFQQWTRMENNTVGQAYNLLIASLKSTAGSACAAAWNVPAISEDSEMNIPPGVIDLSPLKAQQDAYMESVQNYLARYGKWWPFPRLANPGTRRTVEPFNNA